MFSKRAALSLIMVPVLLSAQSHLPYGFHVAQEGFTLGFGAPAMFPLGGSSQGGAELPDRAPIPLRDGDRVAASERNSIQGNILPPKPIFSTVTSYRSGGHSAQSVAVADVNGDGKPDLLLANLCANDIAKCSDDAPGIVSVLLGNGNGTFQTAVAYSSGGYGAVSVAVADVNGDGKPDVLVANQCGDAACTTGGSVSVLLGNGNGTFQTAVAYSSGGYGAVSVAVADVNGDGKLDLLVANQCVTQSCASGGVSVLPGNGNGTFQAALSYDSGGVIASSIAVADVNLDGKPDLLVANNCALNGDCMGNVGVLLGNGDGTFQSAVNYGSGGVSAESVVVGDANGDGKPDLFVANECAFGSHCEEVGSVGVLLGNGDGTFQAAVSYVSSGYNTISIAAADVTGAGKLDLLVANSQTDYSNLNGSVSLLLATATAPSRRRSPLVQAIVQAAISLRRSTLLM